MTSASALRRQIESALEQRIPGALTPRPRVLRDLAATGVAELDSLLQGGLPIGAITELVGPPCSGRTTLALAVLAELTAAGKAVAWVDATDALDPESAAAAGVDLHRQLWVRCGAGPALPSPAPAPGSAAPSAAPSGAPLLAEDSRIPASSGSCGATHPRREVRGLSQAIGAFMQPGAAARALPPRAAARALPPRGSEPTPPRRQERSPHSHGLEARASGQGHGLPRGPVDWKPSLTTSQARPAAPSGASFPGRPDPSPQFRKSPHWKALDQALRATDLLLAGGGFSAIVLDLAAIPPEFAWRIPLATWFRFRAAAERARTVFLLLTQHPCARSSAELVLRLSPAETQTSATVLTGARFAIAIDRQRFETRIDPAPEPSPGLHLITPRKPPQSATAPGSSLTRGTVWQRPSTWAQGGR